MAKYVVCGEELVWFTKIIEADSLEEAEAIVEDVKENADLAEFFGEPTDGDGLRVTNVYLSNLL